MSIQNFYSNLEFLFQRCFKRFQQIDFKLPIKHYDISNESITKDLSLNCKNEAIYQLFNELGFDLVNKIAKGRFGTIFGTTLTVNTLHTLQEVELIDDWNIDELASERRKMVAIKITGGSDNSEKLCHFWTEVSALELLAHPNIVHHFGYFQAFARLEPQSFTGYRFQVNNQQNFSPPLPGQKMYLSILMERLGENLEKLNIDCFTEEEVLHIFRQIGLALAYMHETFSITHNQIKLSNIVTSFVGGRMLRNKFTDYALKLIHFGEATINNDYEYYQGLRNSARVLGWPVPNERKFGRFQHSTRACAQPKSNVFLREAFDFGSMLLDNSSLEPSSILEKALRMMTSSQESNRITIADAILFIEKECNTGML